MKKLFIFLTFCSYIGAFSQNIDWTFLDNKAMGTHNLISENPEYDGRGVVIFILDNAVDPAIPGLTKTSTGETKVIDMQDFSNQLVLNMNEAEIKEIDGISLLANDNTYIEGWRNLDLKPKDNIYYLSVLDEEKYKNSPLKDLNDNKKTNDKFNILAFKIEYPNSNIKLNGIVKPENELWVYYVDEDADGNIDDEEPKFNYKYNYDTFDFYDGKDNHRPLVTMSANINNKKIVINTSDGSHGSHCAGIAAGYQIYGNEGYDGIAPGAYVVSLKIGSNVLSGGATTTESMKKAYEYGIKFMKEAGFKYGVFSMSYGIGAEEPGSSEIADYLNQFVIDNPNAVVVTSNGNNGPGIRSTGTPSGTDNIISVGAMLPPNILKDLYGSARTDNWITHFSSRGGACSKPDVVAPAGASSTVPNYEKGDAFWGTSMSCPQVAGACAVLLSAALKENKEVNHFIIKKAIKYTATPLNGYKQVDYGNGLVNIRKALDYMNILSDRKEFAKILDYNISTFNNYYSDNENSAAYWNNGGYYPETTKQEVKIKAIFPKTSPKENNHNFYRTLRLKSNQNWLKPDKSKVYIRGELPAKIGLVYDKSKLTEPGLYVGRIIGQTINEENGGFSDIEIQTSVVIPYKFSEINNYERLFQNQELGIGDIKRYFVEVPAGASSMSIELSDIDEKNYGMALYLLSPDGNHSGYGNVSDELNNKSIKINKSGKDLKPGVWEIVAYNYFQSREKSFYDLKIKFYGIFSPVQTIKNFEIIQGEKPKSEIKLLNSYNKPIQANASGQISGYYKSCNYSKSNCKKFTKTFIVDEKIDFVKFDISMETEEYKKFTDIAVRVMNESGKAVLSTGLSRKNGSISFHPKSTGKYTLEIVPGFTSFAIMKKVWKFSINEYFYQKEKINIDFTKNDFILYPMDYENIKFKLENNYRVAPEGYLVFGHISISDTGNNFVIKKLNIKI